jgi:predicted HTH transcriptional regulator
MSTSVTSEENAEGAPPAPDFSFLTNHGKTLLLIAHDPRIRMRDIARRLDITERRTQRIVADLDKAGYIERERDGRRNLYTVSTHLPLGLPTQRDTDIGSLLAILPTPSGSP